MLKNNKQDEFFDQYQELEPEEIGILDFVKVFLLGAIIIALILFLKRHSIHSFYHNLSDAFFAASVIILGMGGLSFVTKKGIFDSGGFTVKKVIEITKAGLKKQDKKERLTYYDYKKSKEHKRRRGIRYHYFIIGGMYLIAALVFLKLT